MEIKCIKNLAEAKKYWELLSPKKLLYDDWSFRYVFYEPHQFELFFYVGFENNKPIGLFPLQYNSDDDCLEFFGGVYMDSNRIFIKKGYKKFIPEFYSNISNKKADLWDIIGEDAYTKSLEKEDYNYFLDLVKYPNKEAFLKLFSNNTRNKFVKLFKEYSNVEIKPAPWSKLPDLLALNKERFGEESIFLTCKIDEAFLKFPTLDFDWIFLDFSINNQNVGFSLSVFYNNIYYSLISVFKFKEYSGLGRVINWKNLQLAWEKKAKVFDAGISDCGWKEMWHLDKKMQFRFKTI